MVNVKSFSFQNLLETVETYDKQFDFTVKSHVANGDALLRALSSTMDERNFSTSTVLGVDIYKYSQYEPLRQALVPFLFKLIYQEATELALKQSPYIFQKYQPNDFSNEFISTGDGGFQIFPTPIHAISFAIYFELIVRYYNSYHYYPELRKVIGPVNLRYAMTRDKIFKLDNQFFGPSIIHNDRVLSKDSLNRFLIDENTYNWFLIGLNGIENLQFISMNELNELPEFEGYEIKEAEHIFPNQMDASYQKIISADIQKIGDIIAKSTSLSIYNFHLQYLGGLVKEESEGKKRTMTTVSLGNLNTSGID